MKAVHTKVIGVVVTPEHKASEEQWTRFETLLYVYAQTHKSLFCFIHMFALSSKLVCDQTDETRENKVALFEELFSLVPKIVAAVIHSEKESSVFTWSIRNCCTKTDAFQKRSDFVVKCIHSDEANRRTKIKEYFPTLRRDSYSYYGQGLFANTNHSFPVVVLTQYDEKELKEAKVCALTCCNYVQPNRLLFAQLCLKLDEINDALAALNQYLAGHPECGDGHYHRAIAFHRFGDPVSAESNLSKRRIVYRSLKIGDMCPIKRYTTNTQTYANRDELQTHNSFCVFFCLILDSRMDGCEQDTSDAGRNHTNNNKAISSASIRSDAK